jgi:hypothetical protein
MKDAFDGLITVFAYLGKVDRERNAPDTATIQHFVHFATSANNFFEPVKDAAQLNIEDIDIEKLQDRINVFLNEYLMLQNHIRMYNKTLKFDLSNEGITKQWLEADKEFRKAFLIIKASPRADKLQQISENSFGSVGRVWAMP